MFQKTKLCKSLMLAFSGVAAVAPAYAQSDSPQRIEITGSAIKKIDAETAVPVTIFKVEELKSQGVTSIEQIIQRLSTSQSSTGTSQSVGAGTGGAAFADMRGLGANKTLILLDGHRVADNAIDGSAPDLNMIPFAALERVEVLRDGASSLYGTDAIGGVINFITKKTLSGGQITLQAESPQHSGGGSYNGNIGFGYGDLAAEGYNLMGFLDVQQQDQLKSSQRPFGSSGNIPALGVKKSSFNTFPANYFWGDTDGSYNTANASGPDCSSNEFLFPSGDGSTCRYDYTKWVDMIPKSQRTSGMLKGTFKINEDTQAGLQYFLTQNIVHTVIAPVPYAGLTVNPGTTYFPGGGITPSPSATLDPSLPVYAYWRSVPGGPRQGETKNTQQRLLGTLDGTFASWDYGLAAAYNQNKIVDRLTGGYLNDDTIYAGAASGAFNPFTQDPDDATLAFIQSAEVTGRLQTAKGETWSLNGHASREVGNWFGAGSSALAIGAELRREKFSDVANAAFASIVQSSSGFDPATNNVGTRNIYAVYGELNVPVLKGLEFTAALRDDHYSDFGNTVNPKLSMRFEPMKELLIRSAYSTGFRAPSLYELHAPITYTNTGNPWNDPLLCPNGIPTAPENARYCNTQFIIQAGGNLDLKPEKSKTFTLGFVLEPVANTSASIDLWWVRLQHQIAGLPEELIFGDPTKYAGLFIRNPDGHLSVSGRDCPGPDCGYVVDTQSNLGGTNTNGVDLNISSRLRAGDMGVFNINLNGTYVAKYEYQQEEGGAYLQNAGKYSGAGPIFRWQHTLNASFTWSEWTLGLVNRFKSHYLDQNDPNQVDAAHLGHKVDDYSLWDMYGTWTPTKALSLTVGVRNLADADPPASNQGATFQQGYDPRFTDPLGRSYYVRGTFSF